MIILLLSVYCEYVAAANKGLRSITTVISASDCKLPFTHKGKEYYGCTTADDQKPWCAIIAPKKEQDWRFCDPASIAEVRALKDNRACSSASGWTTGDETIYGCARKTGERDFSCVANGATAVCQKLEAVVAAGVADARSGSTGIILAVVGSLLVIAIVAGLFITRRKSASNDANAIQAQWDYKNPSNVMMPGISHGFVGDAGLFSPGGSMAPNAAAQKVYTVISTYTPTLGDELEIQPGDKVSVLVEYDDGWCQGINHTRGGSKGVFPRHCVDMD